jgi:hypothetical protein
VEERGLSGSEIFCHRDRCSSRVAHFRSIDPDQIIDWLGRTQKLPAQYTKEFGQPPINVYVAEDFYIQVLFWLDATTAIHEHSFAGAFGVLKGSSLHSRYEFTPRKELATGLRLGDVKFLSSELLQQGNVRPIQSGNRMIHSLFHLDEPSVSLVVRTMVIPGPEPQYSFIKPYIAFDPLYQEAAGVAKLRMLESLRRIDQTKMWRYSRDVVLNSDMWVLFQVLFAAQRSSYDAPEEWQALLEVCRQAYGHEVIDAMIVSVEQENMARRLMGLRSRVRDPAHRFLLGLLLNVPTRTCFLQLVSEKYGSGQPELLVTQWLTEMSGNRDLWARFAPELFAVLGSPLLYTTAAHSDIGGSSIIGAAASAVN